jgi:hypothetical protein
VDGVPASVYYADFHVQPVSGGNAWRLGRVRREASISPCGAQGLGFACSAENASA